MRSRSLVAFLVLVIALAVAIPVWLGSRMGSEREAATEFALPPLEPRAPSAVAPTESTPPPAESAPPATATLRVEVRTANQGTALGGVEVDLYVHLPASGLAPGIYPDRQATTGMDGTTRFLDLPPGEHFVSLRVPGRSVSSRAPSLRTRLAPGEDATVVLTLPDGGVLEGVVRRPDGKPLPGARLQLIQTSTLGIQHPLAGIDEELCKRLLRITGSGMARGLVASSDAEGRYQIAGIPASVPLAALGSPETGTFTLLALHRDFEPVLVPVAIASDAPIERDIDFVNRGWPIVVRVVDSSGDPLAEVIVEIMLYRESGGALTHAMSSDAQGEVVMPPIVDLANFASGTVSVLDARHGWAWREINPDDRGAIELVPSTGDGIHIEVVDTNGEPLPGAYAQITVSLGAGVGTQRVFSGLAESFWLPPVSSSASCRLSAATIYPPPTHRYEPPAGTTEPGLFVAGRVLTLEELAQPTLRVAFTPGSPRDQRR